ncbi:MAG: NAD(P)-dependent oxidoreductase [Rhodospirillaceae bacterium]|nr:NAD(P)-dependent oxidoreductase [Rhodospirillaceae bacterium]
MATVAFIGLGVMGFPMAGHLVAKGHRVTVYNRTAARAEAWTDQHGQSRADTPRRAARGAEIVFTCVGDDPDVRAVVTGEEGVLAGLSPGAVIVDHTTASADLARALAAECNGLGVGFIDAPVSGGQSGAENGTLTVMCGGAPAAYDKAAPVVAAYARTCRLMGPSGAGQLTKMVNQICIAGLVQGLAEGMNFGLRAGLDMDAVLDVIGKGAAQSWQMDNRGRTMCVDTFDFGFAVDWMRKDLRICLDEARRNGARLPVAALIDQFYATVQARGHGRWDTSSLMSLLTD